jgi:peptidoglycan/LPS O-acetylase OafA/YrhL
MTSSSTGMQTVPSGWSGAVLTALFLVLAVIVFLLCYYAFPNDQHYSALLLIGVISLIFALGCYLAESLSRNPSYQRSLAWGFFGMGFTVLFLTVGLGPYYGVGFSTVVELAALLILVVVLIVAVALIAWRGRAVRATENQQIPRAAWRNEPAPSAFDYATANSPSVPKTSQIPTAPPSSPPASPPRSP